MKYLEVGKIIATHGIKGEVKVALSTAFPFERFKKGIRYDLFIYST